MFVIIRINLLNQKIKIMSVNLLETIQQNLGYAELQKIDPNTQQETFDETKPAQHTFIQAAIPAVLTGLYRYAQTDAGAAEILRVANSDIWMTKIFETNKKAVLQAVSDYSKQPIADAELQMNAIANEAIKVAKENLADNADIKEVKTFFSDQKNNILLYLPPALNMGTLLHDETMDDNTNKMEGPVSSLIKNIGAAFTNPVTAEDINQNK